MLVSSACYATANTIDNFFTNRTFRTIGALSFFSILFGALFLPLIALVERPGIPPLQLWPVIVLIGLIEFAYLYPYYRSLQSADTSIVTALFSLGKVFVPLFAFLLVGEVLSMQQYVGFGIIVLSSVFLSLERGSRWSVNRSLYLMLVVGLILALQSGLYKYAFTVSEWSTVVVWSMLVNICCGPLLLLSRGIRADIKQQMKTFRRSLHLFALEEFMTFVASAASTYVIALVPVTVEKAVGSTQAFFVMLYAVLLRRWFPNVFRERTDARSLAIKGALFALMIVGLVLVV